MKAIKFLALVLLSAVVACAPLQVPATNMGPLPDKDAIIFVDSKCGGTNLAVEQGRVLAVTATHCFTGKTAQIHSANWDYLGIGEIRATLGDLAYIYYYPEDPDKIRVAEVGKAPTSGDPLWYYGYHFALNSFTPTLGWFTDETTTYEGEAFYTIVGPVVHGFSGSGVFKNGKIIGTVNIGLFGLISRQANWTGILLLKDIPYEQATDGETEARMAPPLMPFMPQPSGV